MTRNHTVGFTHFVTRNFIMVFLSARFEFEDDLIKRYSEIFDRGAALAQLEFDDARIVKSLRRWTKELNESSTVRDRLRLED